MTEQVDEQYVETKFLPVAPQPLFMLVARTKLTRRLDESVRGTRLTLVVAPAGFGKTTLLSAWWYLDATTTSRKAWLSLDRRDRDPVRFWPYLINALRRVDARIGSRALALTRASPTVPAEAIVGSLVSDFVAAQEPFVLVLDDFHLVADSSVPESFKAFVQSVPPHVHVLLASRTEPSLGLPRLRATGQLAEFATDDLRFSPDEAIDLLERTTGRHLEPDALTKLMARTEGWATGLRLAVLSLSGRQDTQAFLADFTGSHRYVQDYLLDEVVLRQPADIQAFLLDTCVLDRLTGELCDALTQAAGGQVMLDRLERAGLFTVALDQQRRWYRYHHLLAEALRTRLDLIDPQRAHLLDRRASDWFEQVGSVEDAVHHAIAAEDYDRVAALVERSADRLWMRSEVKTLLTWLDAFPPEFVAARPALGVYRAWALFFTNRIEAVEAELATVESQLSVRAVPSAPRIGILALSIRACVASVTGQYRKAIDLSRRALQGLEDEPVWRTVVLQSLGTGLRAAGEMAAATQAFVEARDTAAQHGDLSGVIYSACNLGLIRQAMGDLPGAEATYRDAIFRAEAVNGDELPITGMALAGLANVLRERNDLQSAADVTRKAHQLGLLGNYGDIIAEALLVQARITRATGSLAEALATAEEAAKVVERQHVTSRVASELTGLRIQLQLETGARRVADALAPLPSSEVPVFERYPEWLALARLDCAAGRFDAASGMLARLRREDEQAERWGSALKALVLEALCLDAAGRKAESLVSIERALELAGPAGWIRVLADEGYEMTQLLSKVVANTDSSFSSAAVAHARKVLAALAPSEQESKAAGVSPRELEILRLMATGLSNVEVAHQLVVSHTTIKTHINNLYHKLDARNRVQALARARQIGLLG